MDSEMALYREILFCELYKILVNQVTFVGF